MHEFTHCTRSYHVGRGIGGGLAWGGESRILAIREEKKSSAYAPATQYHYTVEKSSAAKVSADVVILPPLASGGLFILFSSRCGYVLHYYKRSLHYILHTVATRKYTHIPLTPPASEARAHITRTQYIIMTCALSPHRSAGWRIR